MMATVNGHPPAAARPMELAARYEDLLVAEGPRSGATIAIAVHSTALGPALGGVRMWSYDSEAEGLADALKLARAMTYKAAAAGLDLGGGKGVICAPPGEPPAGEERRRVLLDFGDAVEALDGRYVTAEDVGTGADDMVVIAERTSHVVGLPTEHGGSGDPSPLTARGVVAAIRACLSHRFGSPKLEGRTVCVIGAGHVGSHLARTLAASGARLIVSDIDEARRRLADELGAEWTDPGEADRVRCDVLAPCALGGTISAANVDRLRCEVVCGSANNVLSCEAIAERLAERGILYAPDFIANAGGLIHVYAELCELRPAEVRRLVDGIGESLDRVLEAAEEGSTTPLAAARELARRRIGGAKVVA